MNIDLTVLWFIHVIHNIIKAIGMNELNIHKLAHKAIETMNPPEYKTFTIQ